MQEPDECSAMLFNFQLYHLSRIRPLLTTQHVRSIAASSARTGCKNAGTNEIGRPETLLRGAVQ